VRRVATETAQQIGTLAESALEKGKDLVSDILPGGTSK
jgi:hypothetical protein